MDFQPGTFVRLEGRPSDVYQVVSVDDYADSCWVRRWPLPFQGSPVFSVRLPELTEPVEARAAIAAA